MFAFIQPEDPSIATFTNITYRYIHASTYKCGFLKIVISVQSVQIPFSQMVKCIFTLALLIVDN